MSRLSQYARGLVWLVVCLASALTAEAQGTRSESTRAEQLFQSGRSALAADNLTLACDQLAESFKLEAATGSLLALAVCHERKHELAQALTEYRQVLSRSLEEGRMDRGRAALAKIEELQAKLSTLTIYTTLAEETPTLTVRVNGTALSADQLGSKLPVQGHSVLVEASAPGKQAWRSSVTISGERQTLYVTIPALAALPGVSEPQQAAPATSLVLAPKPRRAAPTQPRLSKASWTGIALLGASAVTLAVAGGYTWKASKLNRDSEAGCDGNVCDETARALRLDARHAGNVATGTLVAGAALGLAGVVSYWLGRHTVDQRAPALHAGGWASPHAAGASVVGSF